jgi:hypothetical protein
LKQVLLHVKVPWLLSQQDRLQWQLPSRAHLYRLQHDAMKEAGPDADESTVSSSKRPGRPPVFDDLDDAVRTIQANLEALTDAGENPTANNLHRWVCEQARAYLDSKGRKSTVLHDTTLYSLQRRLEFRIVKPDTATPARLRSESDPRNYFPLGASLRALRPPGAQDPVYLFNFDAMVLQTTSAADDVRMYGIVVTRTHRGKARYIGNGKFRVGIKIFTGGNAEGDSLPSVIVLFDAHEGDDVHEVYCRYVPGGTDERPGLIIVGGEGEAPEEGRHGPQRACPRARSPLRHVPQHRAVVREVEAPPRRLRRHEPPHVVRLPLPAVPPFVVPPVLAAGREGRARAPVHRATAAGCRGSQAQDRGARQGDEGAAVKPKPMLEALPV